MTAIGFKGVLILPNCAKKEIIGHPVYQATSSPLGLNIKHKNDTVNQFPTVSLFFTILCVQVIYPSSSFHSVCKILYRIIMIPSHCQNAKHNYLFYLPPFIDIYEI